MKAIELSFNELKDMFENGFYYFTRYGTIKHVRQVEIGYNYVKNSILHKIRFPISDLNKTWFIDKATCSCAASKYLSSLPVPVNVVKKISKLKKEDLDCVLEKCNQRCDIIEKYLNEDYLSRYNALSHDFERLVDDRNRWLDKYYKLKDSQKNTDRRNEKKIVGTTTLDKALEDFAISCSPTTQKKLKALEIIKEKRVDADILYQSVDYRVYNEKTRHCFYKKPLTLEEWCLLKEELL